MASVWLLCGFIGSGKSHWAQRCEQQRGAVRFTMDDWMLEAFGPHMPRALFDQRLAMFEQRFRALAERIVPHGQDVIFDFGFWQHAQREATRQWLADAGLPVQWVFFDTPTALCRERALARSVQLGGAHYPIDTATFDALLATWEPPEPAEQEGWLRVAAGVVT